MSSPAFFLHGKIGVTEQVGVRSLNIRFIVYCCFMAHPFRIEYPGAIYMENYGQM